MTPQEKANELIDKFKGHCFHNFDNDASEQRMNYWEQVRNELKIKIKET